MKRSTRFPITLFNLTVSGLCWLFVVSALSNWSNPSNRFHDFGNPVQYVLSCLAYPMLAFVTAASTIALVASFIPKMVGRIAWRQAQNLLAWTMGAVAIYMVLGFLTSGAFGIGILAWATMIGVFGGATWLAMECARFTRQYVK